MNASSRRDLWTRYVAGKIKKNVRQDAEQVVVRPTCCASTLKTVLGIDPSLRGSGVAVVECDADEKFSLKFSDVIYLRSAQWDVSHCLCVIFKRLQEIIDDYKPDNVALEQAIYVQNVKTAQIMGAVKGVVLTAVKLKDLEIREYPPLRVKQAISGYGRASKEQVMRMVKALLKLPENLPYDASDAAAVALCHFFSSARVG
jgi:crossover junction endodeoxyribonuclease RuvC